MPITIRCPRCGEIRFVAENDQANTITCSGCNAMLRIPTRESAEKSAPTTVVDENPFADRSYAPKSAASETQNPYQAPTLTPESPYRGATGRYGRIDPRLAGRWKRFFGSIIDGLCYAVPALLLSILFDSTDQNAFFIVFGGIAIVMIVNAVLVTTRGQSIGKIILDMKIVKADTDELPGFVHGVLLRSIVPAIIGQIPIVGGIFGLVDPLYIFGEERQCLHDKIAGTKVLDGRLMRADEWNFESHQLRAPKW